MNCKFCYGKCKTLPSEIIYTRLQKRAQKKVIPKNTMQTIKKKYGKK